MTLEASHTSPEFSKPVEEKLSKAQKAIIERVIAILDTDPKLKEALNKALEASFADIVWDEGKFNLLLEKISTTEMQKLWAIEESFSSGKISSEQAIRESKEIISHYTQMKLSALVKSIGSH